MEDRRELLVPIALFVLYLIMFVTTRGPIEYTRLGYLLCAAFIALMGIILTRGLWRIGFIAFVLWAILAPVYAARMAYATIHQSSDIAVQPVPADSPDASRPYILHGSDLHFIGAARGKTREGTSWSDVPASRFAEAIDRWKPVFVVLTGDVTDSGQEREWTQAREILFAAAERAGSIVLIAPGNHDVQPSLAKSTTPAYLLPQAFPGALQLRRYVETAAALIPTSTAPDRRAIGILKDDYRILQPISVDEFNACRELQLAMREPPYRGTAGLEYCAQQMHVRAEPTNEDRSVYETWFPLVYDAPVGGSRFVIMNSSNELTFDIARNGIGAFGARQLEALEKILEAWPPDRKRLVLLLHHPIARSVLDPECGDCLDSWKAFTNSSLYNYFFLRGNTAETRQLIRLLIDFAEERSDVSIAVLTGHRHRRYLGRVRQHFEVVEAPAPHELPGAWLLFEKSGAEFDVRYLELQ